MSEQWVQQLKQLQQMKAKGLISEQDFEEHKAKILAQLGQVTGASQPEKIGAYQILETSEKGEWVLCIGGGIERRERRCFRGGDVALKVMHIQASFGCTIWWWMGASWLS